MRKWILFVSPRNYSTRGKCNLCCCQIGADLTLRRGSFHSPSGGSPGRFDKSHLVLHHLMGIRVRGKPKFNCQTGCDLITSSCSVVTHYNTCIQ